MFCWLSNRRKRGKIHTTFDRTCKSKGRRVDCHHHWRKRYQMMALNKSFLPTHIDGVQRSLLFPCNLPMATCRYLLARKARQAAVVVSRFVPSKVIHPACSLVLSIKEARWIIRLILRRLELAFAKGVLVASPRPTPATRHLSTLGGLQVSRCYREGSQVLMKE